MTLNADVLGGDGPFGIAISGGSDSTALLVLMHASLGASALRAVTINHGLRPEAADEAAQVGRLCAQLDIKHDTIALDLAKGANLQARARTARYAALAAWAGGQAVQCVALGHTRDDVAETFMMRLARGSGVDGLAQMPERFEQAGATFVRPLLGAARSDLRAHLTAQGLVWSDDPSNEDAAFTRVRLRAAMPDLAQLGLSQDRLAQTAQWMRAASDVLEDAAEAWIAAHGRSDHGDAVLDRAALRSARSETAARVLTRALCGVSGTAYRPRFSALAEVLEAGAARTLHGCLIYPEGSALRVTREYNAALQDNSRWRFAGPIAQGETLAPLGETGLQQIENWRETALLPRRSLLSSPALWRGGTVIAAPMARPDDRWQASAPHPI